MVTAAGEDFDEAATVTIGRGVVPSVIDDTDWDHRRRAHAVGYLNGLVRCSGRK